ncbi:MAG: TonB-dependent receptor [Candidatus Ferrigenium altingense]
MHYLNKPVAAICLAVAATVAHAEEAAFDFNIPAQPVSQVLSALSKQTGLQPFYTEDSVKGIQSAGVKGRYSLREAVAKALAGTGLTFQFTAEKAVAIKAANAEKISELPAVEVRGEATPSYHVKKASTATKTNIPIMDTPFSVQVISREVMEDQQIVNMKNAIRNVSGIVSGGQADYDGVRIRGFINDGATTVYRNGLRIRRTHNTLTNVENIEVLKGPAGAIYGRIEPGGMINMVMKKPQEDTHYSIQQQIGSFNMYQTTAEATGALNEDKTLLYRMDFDYKSDDTFVDTVYSKRSLISPVITWRPSTQTEVNFNIEQQKEKMRYWAGIPIVNGRPADIPVNRYLGFNDPNEYARMDKTIIAFDWSHKFNDDWMLKQRFHTYHLDYAFINTFDTSGGVAADGRTMTRGLYYDPYDDTRGYATSFDLTGSFNGFGIKHDVLLGTDYYKELVKQNQYSGLAPLPYRTIDIFNPIYTPINPQVATNAWRETLASWNGIYFQDQMALSPQWKLLVGGRWDDATAWSGSSPVSFAAAEAAKVSVKDTKFSPRAGLVYQPQTWLTVYGNYSESMGGANTGTSASGAFFAPELAQQKEIGFKTEMFDKKLVTNVALYDLTKQNVKTKDLANPAFSIATGEVKNKGLEVDVTGNLTRALSVVATYSYIDSKITKSNLGDQGNVFFSVPHHSGSLWGKYALGGDMHNLSVGAGAVGVGQHYANNANTQIVPGFVRMDAMLAYRFKGAASSMMTAQLNVTNVMGIRYYTPSGYGGGNVVPGAPRTIVASLKADF